MDVVASGAIWDARTAPVNLRTASATSAVLLADGTVLATCRLGSDREGADGHTGVFASRDRGDSWEMRSLSLAERTWDGWPGETRGWYIAELTPGELIASVLWTDRSDPARSWVNPCTQACSGCARTTSVRRMVGARGPTGAASTSGPTRAPRTRVRCCASPAARSPSRSSTGRSTTAAPGEPAAWLRLSSDDGRTWTEDVLVARHPGNGLFYWDQRLEARPLDGRLVNMFWTHDVRAGRDVDVHIAWARPTAARGRNRSARACRASTASRSRSAATDLSRSTRTARIRPGSVRS